VTYFSVVFDKVVRFADVALVEPTAIDVGGQEHVEQHDSGNGHCYLLEMVSVAGDNLDCWADCIPAMSWDSQLPHIVGSHCVEDTDCKLVGGNQFDHMTLLLEIHHMIEALVHVRKLVGGVLEIVDMNLGQDIEVDSDKAPDESQC
jgi:hypothetical protein